MANYNEIVKILRTYSDANFVIKSFGNGEIWELVETFGNDDAEYPKLWAEDIPNTTEDGVEVFKFRIYMLGQVATLKEKTATTLGEDNTNEVKSNMRQNCLDLLSYLLRQTNYPEITVNKNITLTSFKDKSNDKLTGWFFDLNIRQAFRFSSCIIPMDGIPPPPAGTCDDGTVTITDSDGNTLYVKTVTSGGGATQSISDVTNTFNGGAISGVLAEGTKAITLVDDLGAPVTLTILVDTKTNFDMEIPSAVENYKVYRTNVLPADTRFAGDDADLRMGEGEDHVTLTTNNFFGNLERFTDRNGAQLYPDNIVLDWATWQSNGDVLAYQKNPYDNTHGNLDVVLLSTPLTFDGFGDWNVANVNQLWSLAQIGGTSLELFEFPPFNYHMVGNNNSRVWSSTRVSGNSFWIFLAGTVSRTNYFSPYATWMVRQFNVSEL